MFFALDNSFMLEVVCMFSRTVKSGFGSPYGVSGSLGLHICFGARFGRKPKLSALFERIKTPLSNRPILDLNGQKRMKTIVS
jgi:hypothetical protein